MSRGLPLYVEASHCIRCGACAALAPGVFDLTGAASRVAREPRASERRFVEAARWICPTDAIRGALPEESAPIAARTEDPPLFDALARGAELVRWSLSAVPWSEVDPSRATAELKGVVREMAFSENATYSATQRFLEAFFDDVDFSSWLSVWFYEETRHPHVLVEWLARVRAPVSSELVVQGRVSTPFMRSLVGTLVSNVISEITAAQAYRRLATRSPEPGLAAIARLIAGDEARHAATFFRFARRRLEAASPAEALRERARGVEVLQAWLGGAQQTTHPVAQMVGRIDEAGVGRGELDLDFSPTRRRAVKVVGLLLDVSIGKEEDVAPALRGLLDERRHA